MHVKCAVCDPRERSLRGIREERLSWLLGSLLSASPPAPVLALLPSLQSCSLDVQTGLRNALCHREGSPLGGAGEVSSPDGQGALVWRPESEALVQEGACVPLRLRSLGSVFAVTLAVALQRRQARHPQLVIRSPGAGGHGSLTPAPHSPVLLLGRQVTWPCSVEGPGPGQRSPSWCHWPLVGDRCAELGWPAVAEGGIPRECGQRASLAPGPSGAHPLLKAPLCLSL